MNFIAKLTYAALLFISTSSLAQIDILKKGGKLLEKSPTKLLDKYFTNSPITTNFDHAITEVMLMGHFDPPESAFSSLSDLDQNENGDYIVREGLYSAFNKSFCLKAGTYGPSRGDGHLLAPLAGPKAFLVEKLLENWLTRDPSIPQRDVQCLIWAIIARTDVDKMDNRYKLVLARLLDAEDMTKLAANSLKDKALELGIDKAKDEIPPEVYKVYAAERDLRSLYSKANSTYEQFESYAVLAGIAPAEHLIRETSKARWSWHPNGYFIRMTPHGYSSTKVDVYIPGEVTAITDEQGRIQYLTHSGKRIAELLYGVGSALTEVKFINGKEFHTVKTNASLSSSTSIKTDQFNRWLNMEHSMLQLSVDAITKQTMYNLYNAVTTLETVSYQSLDENSGKLLRQLLNEAYNYTIYKNISLKQKNASIENSPDEYLVKSGSSINPINPINSINYSWYKFEPNVLDFPNNVATPANRSAQRIGQSQPPKDKPWYEKLPDCPCTYKAAQDSAKKSGSGWMDCGGASQTHHYGATNEVRWAPKGPNKPGQQCTYDANGDLITSGIGAGSPDRVSPHGCEWYSVNSNSVQSFYGHQSQDVSPWTKIPCHEYLKNWPPNQGNNCSNKKNPAADISHMRDLVGDMTCEQITELFSRANEKGSKIPPDLRDFLNGNSTNNYSVDDLRSMMADWYDKEGCPGAGYCDEIKQGFSNLSGTLPKR